MRNKTITLRLTDEEFKQVYDLSKAMGMNKNQYIRFLIVKEAGLKKQFEKEN